MKMFDIQAFIFKKNSKHNLKCSTDLRSEFKIPQYREPGELNVEMV